MTIISSWGGPDSNAYVNHSQANSYITTAIFDAAKWTAATTVAREAAIITATHDIDSRQYVGRRYYHDQRLEFPRQLRSSFPFNRTIAGTITDDIVQKRMESAVQEATAIQAFFIVKNSGLNKHAERAAQGVRGHSMTMGPITESVQYAAGTKVGNARLDQRSRALLQDYMTGRRIYRA